MTEEETSEQADRASAALRDTILQLTDDALDPQCIIEALIVQAVGLAFTQYGRGEGQHLVEGTMNACFREAATMAPRASQHTDPRVTRPLSLLKKKQAGEKIEAARGTCPAVSGRGFFFG